jgi:hypothetical protein
MRITIIGRSAKPLNRCSGVLSVFEQFVTHHVLCVMIVDVMRIEMCDVMVEVLEVVIDIIYDTSDQ